MTEQQPTDPTPDPEAWPTIPRVTLGLNDSGQDTQGWDPTRAPDPDSESPERLAARGYWQAGMPVPEPRETWSRTALLPPAKVEP